MLKKLLFPILLIVLLASSMLILVGAGEFDKKHYTNPELYALTTLTKTLEQSMERVKRSNDMKMRGFMDRSKNSPDSLMTQSMYVLHNAQIMVNHLIDFVDELKQLLVEFEEEQMYRGNGGSYVGSGFDELLDEGSTQASTKFLSGSNNKYTHGKDLKQLINSKRESLTSLLTSLGPEWKKYAEEFDENCDLKADDAADDLAKKGEYRLWEYQMFYKQSKRGALALLTEIQFDAYTAMSAFIGSIQKVNQLDGKEMDDYTLMVRQNKSFLARGQKLEIEAFIAARPTGIQPVFEVDKESLPVDYGTGTYSLTAAQFGPHEKQIKAAFRHPKTGEFKTYTTSFSYNVVKGDAEISASKNNVVFLGLDNPIEISVPGYEPKDIVATITPSSVGTLVKQRPGLYLARIKRRDRNGCRIHVSVRSPSGKTMSKGYREFRTMKVPAPYANINNKTGGTISTGELTVVRRVNATMSNFFYEGIRFKVTGYSFSYIRKDGTAISGTFEGAAISPELQEMFDTAKHGDQLIIRSVKAYAKGVGTVMPAGALVFDIVGSR